MRILVDMSATLIHHGHIRLLHRASELGRVVVALTTDAEIQRYKGYIPELSYQERAEIVESIRYVQAVVPSPWIIDDAFMDQHNVAQLVHGDDNKNAVSLDRLVLFPRTNGVSSSEIRSRVLVAVSDILKRST